MKVLITGGAGYIGSHTAIEMVAAGHDVVILDNLCNSSVRAIDRVRHLAGADVVFVEGDVRDRALLEQVMARHGIGAVLHFAGLKAVGESVAKPLEYHDANVTGAIRLLEAMEAQGVRRLVFSSSATVYGAAEPPIAETAPLGANSPYGNTKHIIEMLLADLVGRPGNDWRVATLRYFNPVGAHASGLLGESPNGIPNNLMPYITQVAVGKRDHLSVFGDDYPTPDGTGVRDFIHVVDLARGHVAALHGQERLKGLQVFNLGTGRGTSVLELVRAFEVASGRHIPYQIVARRPGDVAACWADPSRAAAALGWRAELDLARMCADSWRWQVNNPNGYEAEPSA